MTMLAGGVRPEQIADELLAEAKARGAIMQAFLPEGQDIYGPWIERMKGMYRMVTPTLGDVKGPSDSTRSATEQARAHFCEFFSSQITTMVANFIGRALNSPPQINTAVIAPEGSEKEKQSMLERVIQGFINEQDQKAQDAVRGTSWLWGVTRDSAMAGKIIGRVEARESYPGSGLLSIDCPLFDPLSCYHDFEGEQRRFIREFRVSRPNAIARLRRLQLPLPVGFDKAAQGPVQMAELWFQEPDPDKPGRNRVWTGAMLDSKLAGDMRRTHHFHWPLIIIATHAGRGLQTGGGRGGLAAWDGRSSAGLATDEMLYHSQPFFAPLQHLYNNYNEFMSIGMMGIMAGLLKNKRFRTREPGRMPTADEQAPGATWRIHPDDQLEFDNETVVGIAELLDKYEDIVRREFARLYHEIHFGISPPGDSGFKGIQQTSASNAIVNEPLRGVSVFLHAMGVEALHQWEEFESGLKIEYKGHTSTGLQAGNLVVQEFELKDMPKSYAFEVNIGPLIPTDNMQSMTYVSAGLQNGTLDMDWAREKGLNLPDSGAVQARIDAYQMHNSPQAQAERLIAKMWDDVDLLDHQAAREQNQIKRLRLMVAAIRARQHAEAFDAQLTGQAQTAASPRPPAGTPPEVLPAEAGLENPDLMAAARGEQSSSTQGRGPSTNGGGALTGADLLRRGA